MRWLNSFARQTLLIKAAIVAILCGVFVFIYFLFFHPLIPNTSPAILYQFHRGQNTTNLSNDLHHADVINNPRLFALTLRLMNCANSLKAGEYRLQPGISLYQLIAKLAHGEVERLSVTFVEGWTLKQILTELAMTTQIDHQLTKTSPDELIAKIGGQQNQLEGWFYPDTYYFVPGDSDLAILKRANTRMHEQLAQAWETRNKDLPYENPEQVLTVASMIEKEASVAKERQLIAAVILKRLRLNMPLQIDATLIYGLGNRYHDALTRNDLILDTPYNTYLHHGLPPTPIAMPSRSAIDAALHPAKTDALYYVAKGDGTHYFSQTLSEHEVAVGQYQRNQVVTQIAPPLSATHR